MVLTCYLHRVDRSLHAFWLADRNHLSAPPWAPRASHRDNTERIVGEMKDPLVWERLLELVHQASLPALQTWGKCYRESMSTRGSK
ncbi:hypothetical protein FQZ97_1047660 [compost metagenome]